MRRLFAGIALSFLLTTVTLFAVPQADEFVQFDLAGGYRIDRLKWTSSFSLEPQNPCSFSSSSSDDLRIISKLKWDSLTMYHILGSVRLVTCDRWYFRAVADYGRIWHGRNSDRDFIKAKCCRPIEFIGSRADANEGEAFDLSVGAGYYFRFLSGRGAVAPIAGYSHHEQHLRMRNLHVVLDTIDFMTGPVPGLHSNYRAQWFGPWAGADFSFKMTCNLELYGRGEFHWTLFRGTGHWNLRPEFVKDFHQHTRGYGQVYFLGINYDWTELWKVGILYNLQRFNAVHGRLRQFFESGSADIKLNSVYWFSQSIMANVQYTY